MQQDAAPSFSSPGLESGRKDSERTFKMTAVPGKVFSLLYRNKMERKE